MRRSKMLAGLATAAIVVSGAGAASAQDDLDANVDSTSGLDGSARENEGDDVIVVTARRREESLADLPASAAVLSDEYLQQRGGPRSAEDLLAGQAGVRFFDTTSPVNSEVSIRGSSTARATNADPSVGLFRDGVYIGGGTVGGRSFARIDIFDAKRVEVLRGVQGALYGRNAVGGAVNLITTKPQFENSGYVDLRYTTQTEGAEGQAVVNVSPNDNFALRFGVDGVHQDKGFFYNPSNDIYFDRQEGQSYRGQLRYKNDRLDITVLGERQNLDVPSITYRVVIAPGPIFPLGFIQPPFEYDHSTAPFAHQEITTGSIAIEYDLGWATFHSTTLIRQRNSEYTFDSDAITPEAAAQAFLDGLVIFPLGGESFINVIDKTRTITEVAYFNGALFDDRVSWLAGFEYLSQRSDSLRTTQVNQVAGLITRSRANVDIGYDSYAFFGSLGFDLTSRLNLTGELRYTNDDRTNVSGLVNDITGMTTGGDSFNFAADRASDNISYNATLAYKFVDDWQIYGKVGSSYRAGGFNSNLGIPIQPIPIPAAYGDESTREYEGGLKGQFGDIYVALAGYVAEADNLIVQRDNGCSVTLPACPVGPTSFLDNTGKARNWGVEAEITGAIDAGGGKLTATLAASRQDGKVTSGPLTGIPTAQTPNWLASSNLNYSRQFNDDVGIFANLFLYGQWGGTQELTVPSPPLDNFQIVNLRLGFTYAGVEFAGFINNVFDAQYLTFQEATTQRLGTPRTTGVEVRFQF